MVLRGPEGLTEQTGSGLAAGNRNNMRREGPEKAMQMIVVAWAPTALGPGVVSVAVVVEARAADWVDSEARSRQHDSANCRICAPVLVQDIGLEFPQGAHRKQTEAVGQAVVFLVDIVDARVLGSLLGADGRKSPLRPRQHYLPYAKEERDMVRMADGEVGYCIPLNFAGYKPLKDDLPACDHSSGRQ